MKEIVFYVVSLVVLFLLYYVFVICNKKRLQKFSKNTYVMYLINVYKLDKEKIGLKQLALSVIMINSFIIATTVFIVGFVDNLILKFILSFIVLIPLQLLMYHIVGKTFEKRFRREKECIILKKQK